MKQTIVKITAGHFEGFYGIIQGYHDSKAIVMIPFDSGESASAILESRDYEVTNS